MSDYTYLRAQSHKTVPTSGANYKSQVVPICTALLYKGLEHPWILVSTKSQNQSPVDTKGWLYFWLNKWLSSPTQMLSEFCYLGGFMELSPLRHDWLIHWPLVIVSTSRPSPLPGGQGMGLKVTCLGLSGDQLPSWSYPRAPSHQSAQPTKGTHHFGYPKGFTCQELGTKTKRMYFLLYDTLHPIY